MAFDWGTGTGEETDSALGHELSAGDIFGGIATAGVSTSLTSKLFRGEGDKRYRHQLRSIIEQARGAARGGYEEGRGELQKGLAARVGGYNEAIARTSGIGRAGKREALTRGKELESQLTGQYGGGGRFGTTALDNARMGLQSSVTRDLEAIDEGFAALFGNLAVGRGETEAAGRSQLAELAAQAGLTDAQLIQLLMQTVRKPKKGLLGDVLGIVGGVVGGIYGGPGGGAAGGEAGSAIGGSLEVGGNT